MSKAIKTPALVNANFAADNIEKALRTFTSVVNGVQYVIEAETAAEATAKLEEILQNQDLMPEPKPENS